jgi:hypothetical protein
MIKVRSVVSRYLRAAEEPSYKIEGIRIFFSAPAPKEPSSETLTIDKDVSMEANFQWISYQVLFSSTVGEEAPKYYIYDIGLDTDGTEKFPDKVFESDSDWSGKNKNSPTRDISPGEVRRLFPKVLKGPNLFPVKSGQTVYVNTTKGEEETYSSEEFKKNFDNNFYIVLNSKTTRLENPFREPLGRKGVK